MRDMHSIVWLPQCAPGANGEAARDIIVDFGPMYQQVPEAGVPLVSFTDSASGS